MAIAKFMSSMAGRLLRIVAGIALLVVGLLTGGTTGIVLAVVGVVPVLAGVFNVCLIAPLLGAPFLGRDLK
jgi:hypothetical protein